MKALEVHEWQYITKALLSLQIPANDARAFIDLIDKLEHQTELAMKRDNKKSEVD